MSLNIFELIGELFKFLFIPLKWIRLTLAKGEHGWWTSNAINWVFVFILLVLLGYWLGQTLKFKREGIEDHA